jgi:hypothetical protein
VVLQYKVHKVQLVHKVLKVTQDHKDHKVLKVQQVHKVLKVIRDHKDHKVLKVLVGLQ